MLATAITRHLSVAESGVHDVNVFPPAIPNSDHLRLLKALRFELHYTLPKYMHIRTLKYASDMYPSTITV